MRLHYSRATLVRDGFTLIELLVVIAIIGILSAVVLAATSTSGAKARDASRISEVRQIAYALELYYADHGLYPTCLYGGGTCVTSLQGTTYMKTVPKDPSTDIGYSYAGLGSGANCSSYHLGSSLEDNHNPVMQTGADASPKTICTGSLADFSGLSFAAKGQLCNTTAGTPQPTQAANGETCYDLTP